MNSRTTIRFRITCWFTFSLILLLSLTFLAVLYASSQTLKKTIRSYLISTVEENVDEITYKQEPDAAPGIIPIAFSGGYIHVDDDFMGIVNDVRTALYDVEGSLLYGENPLPHETEAVGFRGSRIWTLESAGMTYLIYDRKLILDVPSGETLWIRGVVSEAESRKQIRTIARDAGLILLPLTLLAIILSWALAGRVLSPVRTMQKTAESITTGHDLHRRIEMGKGQDELSQLANVFNHMLDRLEEAFEKEQQFTSDVSHELRTPMTVIMAQCETVLETVRTPEEYEEAFRVVRRQGGRMSRLIEDMLVYTRMERTGDVHYPMTELDLSSMTQEMTSSLALLQEKGITLTAEIEPDIWIQGNRQLLERLLQNLITNAYRYGKENGWIRVSLVRKKEGALLTVQDNGIGISEEDLKHIFDRFFRADASRSAPGTGLGLSMVQKIAELHGARIHVDSEQGQGSIFTVFFGV